mgnify:CR=1 FL=1|jgi:hypothetical protein
MLLWIIAKLLIHFLFAIIWEMKNMLFYMLLFHIFKQWRFIGLSESVDTLRHEEVSTVISFVNSINLALAIPTNDKEANLITVVDSNFPNINKISVHMKGSITGGSNAGVRVIFIGK